MDSRILLTRTHLEQALTPEQVRPTIIIRIGLMLGIFFFYLATFVIHSIQPTVIISLVDANLMDILSGVHAVIMITMMVVSFVLSKNTLRKERIASDTVFNTPEKIATQAVNLHRVSSLLLMAPLEGAAFFGAAVCLIGVEAGIIQNLPIYWLNTISGVVLLGVGFITFPTRDRILTTLESVFILDR